MLTLSLLRHAKSSWDNPALDDYDRPLAQRGLKAAPLIGVYMARNAIRPDLILCSGAKRTRETLDLVLAEQPLPHPPVFVEDALYHASATTLLTRLTQTETRDGLKNVRHILIIGHDPGFHILATALAGSGDEKDRSRLREKYPTGTLTTLTFDSTHWANLKHGSGHLVRFVTPKSLGLGA
jgi:phosphohistidine phosphatase